MFRSSAILACLAAGLGLSSAAGLALAFGHEALNNDTALLDDGTLNPPRPLEASPADLRLAQVSSPPAESVGQPVFVPSPLAVPESRRPVARPQGGIGAAPQALTNHAAAPRVVPRTTDFSRAPLAVAPPLAAVPVQPWSGQRNVRPLNKMPNLDSAWKSGVYR